MKTTFSYLMLLVALTATNVWSQTASAGELFRGIPKAQGGNEILNSPSEFAPFFIDISDTFARDGNLVDTVADGWRVGFVSPQEIDPATGVRVADGPLQGFLADQHGRWMATDDSYVSTSLGGGSVQRVSDDGPAVACLPWRVWSGLGDSYYLEMSAIVARGESVSLGYVGDPAFGFASGLDSRLGQLVLNVSRGTGANANRVTTSVAWDMNGQRADFTTGTFDSNEGEEITLGLGWEDMKTTGIDLFDAWLIAGGEAREVLGGSMNAAIDVFGVGFQLSGTGSRITGFLTAVPEPTSGAIMMLGLLMAGRLRSRLG